MSATVKPKVVFMGTPEFAVPCLQALHEFAEVTLVVSQPDRPQGRHLKLLPTPVKKCALELGIPVIQPEKKLTPEHVALIQSHAPDFLVVVAFGQILKSEVLSIPRFVPINVHGSLLPRWRGAAPIQRALESGDELSGVCTMKMEVGLDSGPIYLSDSLPNTPEVTSVDLFSKLSTMGAKLLKPTLLGIMDHSVKPVTQDETLVTHAKKLKKEEGFLDFTQLKAIEADRKIRAFQPWPGCKAKLVLGTEHIPFTFVKARVVKSVRTLHPGRVEATDLGLEIHTLQDLLVLEYLKPEGRSALRAHDFLNGLRSRGYTEKTIQNELKVEVFS